MTAGETLPPAIVVHHMGGRARFRVPARRGDPAYFDETARVLLDCPGVDDVQATPLTGGLLVFHRTDLETLVRHARRHQLFDVGDETRPEASEGIAGIERRMLALDRWIRVQAGPGADLRSVMLATLLVGGAWQMLRGRLLPAGGSLFWYAFSLLPVSLLMAERREDR